MLQGYACGEARTIVFLPATDDAKIEDSHIVYRRGARLARFAFAAPRPPPTSLASAQCAGNGKAARRFTR